MNQLVDNFFSAEKALHDYFGYQESWRRYPIEDYRNKYWKIVGSSVVFGNSKDEIESDEDGRYCDIDIIGSLDVSVMRRADLTMILCDTNTDGNIGLFIFDNAKEVA